MRTYPDSPGYIPFHEATDIGELAIEWQWAKVFKDIRIVRHKTEFFAFADNEKLRVYVLGHGLNPYQVLMSDCHHHIMSFLDLDPICTILPVEQIAERFVEDFLLYLSQITEVRLYFCNLRGTEKALAELFHESLPLPQFKRLNIYYYSGMVSIPLGGHKLSFDNDGDVVRASQTQRKLGVKTEDLDSEDERDKENATPKNVKAITMFQKSPKIKHREDHISKCKNNRQELFSQVRLTEVRPGF